MRRRTTNRKWGPDWRVPGALTLSLMVALLGITFGGKAAAEEIWLYPANEDQKDNVGNWAVAKIDDEDETHFSFHVPDNFDESNQDSKAIIVVIPKKDGFLNWTVNRNKARNGAPLAIGPL